MLMEPFSSVQNGVENNDRDDKTAFIEPFLEQYRQLGLRETVLHQLSKEGLNAADLTL